MKKLMCGVLFGIAVLFAGVAVADEVPAVEGQTVEAAAPSVDASQTASESCGVDAAGLPLSELQKGEPQPNAVCGCRDLCKNDGQCELFYGPGSVCLPTGPCGCRQCFAAS